TEKELLAVHNALMHFRSYIGSRPVKIKTDHKPLVGILSTKKSAFGPRWSRRLFQLAEFVIEVEYIEGVKNVVPDALSRMVNAIHVRWDSVKEAQRYDEDVQQLVESHDDVLEEEGVAYLIK